MGTSAYSVSAYGVTAVLLLAACMVGGVPVRGSYLTAVVSHGNLVLLGAELLLAAATFFFCTSFPPGALYGAMQAAVFYLVLAMGLGFGNATHAIEGFGILSMASIGPIITVMITGLWTQFKARRQRKAALAGVAMSTETEAQSGL